MGQKMSIDIHNHIIPQSVIDLCLSEPAYGVTVSDGQWHSPNIHDFPLVEAWFDPSAKLREMDGKELDQAVLSAAPKPLYYYELELKPQELIARTLNRGAADFCAGHQDRIRWMASVPLAFPDSAAGVLSDAVDLGASGVEIGISADGRTIDLEEFEPFWAAVERLGVPVFLHPAYEHHLPEHLPYQLSAAIGLPSDLTTVLERLIASGTLDRHPNATIVAALGGGTFPYLAGRLRHYSSITPGLRSAPQDPWSYVGQLKFDSHLHDPVALEFLIKKAGDENVLIGTDCSFLSATPAPMEELRAAVGTTPESFEKVAHDNAATLFWKG
jgi:aminocarboxymuconate-semialdehyde decarboxylase